jgi:hypothetical protein
MQHYKERELEPSQGEDWYAEEDSICDLQCADSLAVAANRIREQADGGCFRVKASALAVADCLRICSHRIGETMSASGGA